MVKTKIQKKKLADICHSLSKIKSDLLLIIIDAKVAKIYGTKIKIPGKKVITWVALQGEKCKTFESYQKCSEFFLKQGIHRKAHLIAIGGGATSDLAGYVASTLMRGIEWSVIPTTLLAMVDASIGGKTAINVGEIKNQLGTFYAPQNVWLDFSFLKTLSSEEILSGKGEILKYTFLSPKIANVLEKNGFSSKLIVACAEYKNELVKKDFDETKNLRIHLNLGHTLGHAYEQMWGLPHGLAVACGIGEVFRLYHFLPELELWRERMSLLGFNISMERLSLKNIKQMIKLIGHDKKKTTLDKLQIILPYKNKTIVKTITLSQMEKDLKELHGY